jgi:lipoprotein-anchoring transpeptidase ErfK/SrfK
MPVSRRDFLKMGLAGVAAGFAPSRLPVWIDPIRKADSGTGLDSWKTQYKSGDWLGRVISSNYFSTETFPLRSRPTPEATKVGEKKPEEIIRILREVVGAGPQASSYSHRWFETPEGYIYAPRVYPQAFQINQPLETISGERVWVEVTVPWLEGRRDPSDSSPILVLPGDRPTLLYYASIYPATGVVKDDQGKIWYRLEENAPVMYARAEGMRVIAPAETEPIHPEVENKEIVVDLDRQSLSALEDGKEVYYAIITSGPFLPDKREWITPSGNFAVYWKRMGVRMEAGTSTSGYSDPGVGWASYFISSKGIAIHSTYWHNSFGEPGSNGCINARPQDAQWIFRWTSPALEYAKLEIWDRTWKGTRIRVISH